MPTHETTTTPLIDLMVAVFPNAEPCYSHGLDSAVVEAPGGWLVATTEHDDVIGECYQVGIYTPLGWLEGYDSVEHMRYYSVPRDAEATVALFDTLTEPPVDVDWWAWANQWLTDAITDGRVSGTVG